MTPDEKRLFGLFNLSTQTDFLQKLDRSASLRWPEATVVAAALESREGHIALIGDTKEDRRAVIDNLVRSIDHGTASYGRLKGRQVLMLDMDFAHDHQEQNIIDALEQAEQKVPGAIVYVDDSDLIGGDRPFALQVLKGFMVKSFGEKNGTKFIVGASPQDYAARIKADEPIRRRCNVIEIP